jgi:hypothetical protein
VATTNAPAQPAPARQGMLARHPLVSFFGLAYAFSWVVWAPWVLGEDGAGLLPIKLSDATSGLLNAAAILAGPTLSAFKKGGRACATCCVGTCCGGWEFDGTFSPSWASPW